MQDRALPENEPVPFALLVQIDMPALPDPATPPEAARAIQQIADHRTPLIRNCWYLAAISSEVTRELRERTLLGTQVLMYRKLDGSPVIMNNRCVHRSFPLSKGRLDGDNVICGYHGMVYDPSGQCIGMPSLARPPSHARTQAYPAVERGPLVWVWMGDPALADAATIPETGWLASPQWTTVCGQFHIRTNYVAMHENLLDQTHFAVLHADTVGTPDYARSELRVETDGDQVRIERVLRQSEPPPIYGIPMKLMGRKVDRYSDSRFASPALHIAHARIVNPQPQPGELGEYRVNIVHLFTPEYQDSIHYWWFNSRDFSLDDPQASEFLAKSSRKAYQEDVDALGWIQDTLNREPGPVQELSFGPDRPGLMMRRNLLRLANAESHGIAMTSADVK